MTPYKTINKKNTNENITQNQTDNKSKLLLQFKFFTNFHTISTNIP